MIKTTAPDRRSDRRGPAMIGLAGAALTAIGDVLILGRNFSGPDFDHASVCSRATSSWSADGNRCGTVPSSRRAASASDNRWAGRDRSPGGQACWDHPYDDPGRLRGLAAVSAAAFAVSGVLTHAAERWSGRPACGAERSRTNRRPALPPATSRRTRWPRASLTGFSVGRRPRPGEVPAAASSRRSARRCRVCWNSADFGVGARGGYARPASISIGLMVFFTLVGASLERPHPPQPTVTG